MGTSLLKRRIAEISHFAEETQQVVFLTGELGRTSGATQRRRPGQLERLVEREVGTVHANVEGSCKF